MLLEFIGDMVILSALFLSGILFIVVNVNYKSDDKDDGC